MAIYRGIGGAGDSTTDATVQAVTEQAVNAATSATNAASSASSAASSATAASTSASNAATSASAASTDADDAAASAAAALASETAAATSETNAATSETNAATSETNAATSETNAATSETNAATSETNAATSASNAATSETNAASSASAAATSATNASNSATAAQTAQTAAETAQAAAEAAQEAIDGLYLGAQTSDPSVDLNGDPVTAGDWYYNTTTAVTRIYDGSAWNNGAVSTNDFLLAVNNLSDLDNATTARTNLGLGTAATTDATDYATAAQGSNADTAYGWGDHSLAGYLSSYTESDPVYTASSWFGTTNNASQWDTAYGWGDHASAGYYSASGGTVSGDVDVTGTVTATAFSGDGSALTGIDTLPDQTGNSGKYLTTDGTDPSWAELDTDANSTTKGLYEHSNTISTNYTIGTGNNAMSTGPMTIASGVSVTVPSGSRWVIV